MRYLLFILPFLLSCGGGNICQSEINEKNKIKKELDYCEESNEQLREDYQNKTCSFSEID